MSDVARAIFGKENYTNREKCKKILEENNIDWKQWLKSKERHNYCLQCGKEILGVDRFRKKWFTKQVSTLAFFCWILRLVGYNKIIK